MYHLAEGEELGSNLLHVAQRSSGYPDGSGSLKMGAATGTQRGLPDHCRGHQVGEAQGGAARYDIVRKVSLLAQASIWAPQRFQSTNGAFDGRVAALFHGIFLTPLDVMFQHT